MNRKPRVRLRFAKGLWAGDGRPPQCWYEVLDGLSNISQFLEAVASDFKLSDACDLRVELDGCALLPKSPVSIIRDGDSLHLLPVPLSHKAATTNKRQAATNHHVTVAKRPRADAGTLVLARELSQPGTAVIAGQSSLEESSSEDNSSAAAKATGAAGTQSSLGQADHSAQLQTSKAVVKASAEAEAQKRTPSRNACRKAAKRRLRRLGVLPGRSGKQPQAAGQDTAGQNELGSAKAISNTAGASAQPKQTALAIEQHNLGPQRTKPQVNGQLTITQNPTSCTNHQRIVSSSSDTPAGSETESSVDHPDEVTTEQHQPASTVLPATSGQEAGLQRPVAQQMPLYGSGAVAEDLGHMNHVPAADAWQQQSFNAQGWQYRDSQRSKGRTSHRNAAEAKKKAVANLQAETPAMVPHVDQADLQHIESPLLIGDIIAYQMMEIGLDRTPQLSKRRFGKVSSSEFDGHIESVLLDPSESYLPSLLLPWPDREQHPARLERAAAAGMSYAAYVAELEGSDADEEPPSDYQEDGSLLLPFVILKNMFRMKDARARAIKLAAEKAAAHLTDKSTAASLASLSARAATAAAATAAAAAEAAERPLDPQQDMPSTPSPATQQLAASHTKFEHVGQPVTEGGSNDAAAVRSRNPPLPFLSANAVAPSSIASQPGSGGATPIADQRAQGGPALLMAQFKEAQQMLQQRRAQLAAGKASAGGARPSGNNIAAPTPQTSKPAASSNSSTSDEESSDAQPKNVASTCQPQRPLSDGANECERSQPQALSGDTDMRTGHVPMRGGARHSAVAGVLRRLRLEQSRTP